MRYFKFVIGFLLIFLLTVSFVFAESKPRVKVISVLGDSKYLSSGGANWQALEGDEYLYSGDSIKTGSDAYVNLAFDNEKMNMVGIEPSTYIVLKLEDPEKIELIDGEVFALINNLPPGSSFEIRTPTAVSGARGTGWGTKANKNETIVSGYKDDSYVKGVNKEGTSKEDEKIIKEKYKRFVKLFKDPSKLIKLTLKELDKGHKWRIALEAMLSSKRKSMERMAKDLEKIQETKQRIIDKKAEDRIRNREESTSSGKGQDEDPYR